MKLLNFLNFLYLLMLFCISFCLVLSVYKRCYAYPFNYGNYSNICRCNVFGVGSLPRMGYYYLVSTIVVYPNIAQLLSVKYGKIVALIFIVMCIGYAVKTSLPWLTELDTTGYRYYEFVFYSSLCIKESY